MGCGVPSTMYLTVSANKTLKYENEKVTSDLGDYEQTKVRF